MDLMQSKENRIHISEIKPYTCYKSIIPDYFAYVPMHWHNEFEINFIREGEAEFICGEEKFISSAGDIIITLPNELHSVYPHDASRQVYDTLVFGRSIFGAYESDRYMTECIYPLIDGRFSVPRHITSEHCFYSELEMIAENIFSCAKGNSPQLDMLMRSEILRLFWLLMTQAEEKPHISLDGNVIRPSLEYISEHYSEKITVLQLAQTVHMSESCFMRKFRKYVGLSAIEYISHFRIDKACHELLHSEKNILEIAFECGFGNISNFNRQFRKNMNCTPGEYRAKTK